MAAVHSAVGMNLEVEADADPAVEPARPASRPDPLLQKLALQRDALLSGGGGADQVSEGQEVKRNIHSSSTQTLARPLLAFFGVAPPELWRRHNPCAHTTRAAALVGITPAAVAAGVVLLARGYL